MTWLFHQRVIRNSADRLAYCLLSCFWSASSEQPSLSIEGGAGGFFWHVAIQQVWLHNEWRSFFIQILSATQHFSRSAGKECLQMSPCKLTTCFGRKLEAAKTIQEPGWDMVINFLSMSLLKGETIVSFSTQQKKEESWHIYKKQYIWSSNLDTQCREMPQGCLLSCVAVISSQSSGICPIHSHGFEGGRLTTS